MHRIWPNARSAIVVPSSLAMVVALGACLDQGPVASLDPPPVAISSTALQVFECVGSVDATVSCTIPDGPAGSPAAVVVGGQGSYLQLTSSNVSYDGGAETFSFDVTVQNLLEEAIGTPDGTVPDPDGIRVFFADGPTATGGEGTISVMNAAGVDTFTGSDQPYFAYDEILETGEVSAARTWQLGIPPTVTTFAFTVFVETDVQPLLVINEVMANPAGVFGTDGQWFEVYNAGTLAVDLQAMVIADSAASGRAPYHVVGQSLRVTSGGFAVLGASTDLNGGAPVDYAYGSSLELDSASDAIKIARVVGPDTLTIDRVSWTDGSIAAKEGVSRELISPDLDNSAVDGLNWVDGSDVYGDGGLGTPGANNTAGGALACVALDVGEALTTTLAEASLSCFTGSTEQEYAFIPMNPSESDLPLTVMGSGIQAVTGPPSPVSGANGVAGLFRGASGLRPTPFRAPVNDGLPTASAARGVANLVHMGSGVQRAIEPGVPTPGDLWDLNVGPGCIGTPDMRTGEVVAVGATVIIVADLMNPPEGFTPAQYDSIALEADSIAYPVITENFGTPSDIDGNDRIVLFFTRALNELGGGTPALFLARDLTPATIEGCSQSNVGELIYLSVPDPLGTVDGNPIFIEDVRSQVIAGLGSELQRLVNAARRIHVNGGGEIEEAWLDRGLSGIARELMFYRVSGGLAPGQNIDEPTLTADPGFERQEAFQRYLLANLFGFYFWMQLPEGSAVFGTDDSGAEAGALWAFLRYAADRRGGSEADFWASLVDSNLTGRANLANAIGADPDEWLRDFAAAAYADDAVSGVDPAFTYPSWNFRSVFGIGFPLVTRPLSVDAEESFTLVERGSAAYVRFGVPAQGQGVLTVTSGGLPTTSAAPLVVLRTR